MDDSEKYRDLLNHEGDGPGDELSDFLKKSGSAKVPSRKNKEEIWSNISEAIDEDREVVKTPIWRYLGIAASIILIATISFTVFNQEEDIQVIAETGEKITEILPDGSEVVLNASSSIIYSEDWDRRITLHGEAFFEVRKGDKFIVTTAYGTVQVLGTSFNVFARDGDFEVSCKTGKVKVTIPSKSFEETIEPGQIVHLKSDTVRRIDRLPDLIGKWNSGEFYFNHQPISEVFDELQRQFSIEIEFEDTIDQDFSGYFTNKDLENALDMVCLPLGLEYQRTGQNTFAISKSAQ